MDHAFGFKTDDVRSDFYYYKYLLFIFLFYVSFYLLIVWLFYFIVKHEILFTNFARAEFNCIFSFVSLLFIALF